MGFSVTAATTSNIFEAQLEWRVLGECQIIMAMPFSHSNSIRVRIWCFKSLFPRKNHALLFEPNYVWKDQSAILIFLNLFWSLKLFLNKCKTSEPFSQKHSLTIFYRLIYCMLNKEIVLSGPRMLSCYPCKTE